VTGEDRRPVLFVTGHAPPSRTGAFRLLAERERVGFALFGGRWHHGAGVEGELDFPHVMVDERAVHGIASSGRYRAVIASTGGRIALLAAAFGARRAEVPLVLWASLWSQPRSRAGIAGYPAVAALYRTADAVVTYGPHVSSYVRARGAHPVFEAPQAVDNAFWGGRARPRRLAPFVVLVAGRLEPEKGTAVVLGAWETSGLGRTGDAALVLAGDGPLREAAAGVPGVRALGPVSAGQLRNLYAGADVAVMASVRTATFREPWGLVANEAMNRGVPVIASDEVGAAAGGLVTDGGTGLVVPAGDADALAAAITRIRDDPALRTALGRRARAAVSAYTFDAWATGFSRALRAVGAAGDC
jgi:glycosyltransferase involved in cell wall biosynthesis